MRVRFETFFRALIVFLVVLLAWSIWASAQTTTNQTAITAAITSLSIGGLAVGLAAQHTLANLFGALAVFVDRPFRVGDQIKLDGAAGIGFA